jgi:transketolase
MNILRYDGTATSEPLKKVFGSEMRRLIESDPQVVYLDADLMNSFGTLALSREYPDRCIDCGVQEADMVGLAAGLSAVGKKPFVHSFGPFASRRCFDQAFLSVGYAGNSVRIIGSDPGVTAAFNGGTHMPFEDVALYRTVPGGAVIDIADDVALRAALELTKDRPGVTYIRTPRGNVPAVYAKDAPFAIGKANVLKDGRDVTILAAGILVPEALKAADALAAEGISAAVIDAFTIKPLDEDTVLAFAQKTGALVTAENANLAGGLGEAVAALLGERHLTPLERVGVQDRFGQVGPVDFLKEEYGLTAAHIVEKAHAVLSRK